MGCCEACPEWKYACTWQFCELERGDCWLGYWNGEEWAGVEESFEWERCVGSGDAVGRRMLDSCYLVARLGMALGRDHEARDGGRIILLLFVLGSYMRCMAVGAGMEFR